MGTMYVPCVLGDQKRAADPLELDLPMAGSHHVGVGNQTWVLWRSSQCFELLSHLSRHRIGFSSPSHLITTCCMICSCHVFFFSFWNWMVVYFLPLANLILHTVLFAFLPSQPGWELVILLAWITAVGITFGCSKDNSWRPFAKL